MNTNEPHLLVTGATGLLGRPVLRVCAANAGWRITGTSFRRSGPGLEHVDLSRTSEIPGFLDPLAPTVIIQASATYIYTPVLGRLIELLTSQKQRGMKMLARVCLLFLMLGAVSCLAFWIAGRWLMVTLFGPEIETHVYLVQPALVDHQARVVRGGDHGNRRNNDANEQAEWQFPKPQKVVPDHARQSMALVASNRPFNLA